MYSSTRFQKWYNGSPKEKLAEARALFSHLTTDARLDAPFLLKIEGLRNGCHELSTHMNTMQLGQLCCRCGSQPGGGCCSAYMADNTDSMQMVINLLLGVELSPREPADNDCCFLGPRGCLFMAKPIFCLNYNCTHILTGGAPTALVVLEQCTASVLTLQIEIETLLLEILRHGDR
nr:hypothetical protein [uncultured Desulfobulbus sp.]